MRLILGFALLCATLFAGCGHKGKVATGSLSYALDIEISSSALESGISDTLKLGSMRQGEIIAKSIRLSNIDSMPHVILREATSCGCTKATFSRQPIAAGASCDINIEFNSQGQMGWQMKLLEFYFAEMDTPLKIYIDAEVE